MLCPFCLCEQEAFEAKRPKNSSEVQYFCGDCSQLVPASYVRGYRQFPPIVVSAVGFRTHGKTIYLASLFHELYGKISRCWPKFWARALNDESQVRVEENRGYLAAGDLPPPTPKNNFPIPTIVRINGVPGRKNATLLMYDTGGEDFEQATTLIQYARFVQRSRTVMFLIDLNESDDPAMKMHDLLTTYLNGMDALQGDTRRQHLVVVFTKADAMSDRLGRRWRDIHDYLFVRDPYALADCSSYTSRMRRISRRLEKFVKHSLEAQHFLSMAKDSFASVSFSIISALGAEPIREEGGKARLAVGATPKRVVDPLLWIMECYRRWRLFG